MYLFFHRQKSREHRLKGSFFLIILVFPGDVVIRINILASKKISDNHHRILSVKSLFASVITGDNFPFKECDVRFCRPFTKRFLGLFLKSAHEIRVTFVGNDGQFVNLLNILTEFLIVHPVTLLIHAYTQATSDFLSLGYRRVRVTECADLEHIWIVPSFTERGV